MNRVATLSVGVLVLVLALWLAIRHRTFDAALSVEPLGSQTAPNSQAESLGTEQPPLLSHVDEAPREETRTPAVGTQIGTTIFARLLDADGTTPIAGVRVTLAPSPTDKQKVLLTASLAQRKGERASTSAADGSVRFDAVQPGNYELRAERTPRLVAQQDPVAVVPEDREKRVDLVLPPNGWLVGRIIGFEKTGLDGCALLVTSVSDPEPRARSLFMQKTLLNPVEIDGSFRAGPLRAGTAVVQLQYPSIVFRQDANTYSTRPGATELLGEVEIPPGGELRKEFDLTGQLPGRVQATVRVPGVRITEVMVTVLSMDEVDRTAVIDLDVHGSGKSGPVPAGPVHFRISDRNDNWDWFPPGEWSVESGEILRLDWDVPLITGTLTLVEAATGAALGKETIFIAGQDPGDETAFDTDLQGRVELSRVRGKYRLIFGDRLGIDGKGVPGPYQDTEFEWTASTVLRIAKRP